MIRLLLFGCFFTSQTIAQMPAKLQSALVILNVDHKEQKVLLQEGRHFEAPNWSRDGEYLVINAAGYLEKIDMKGKHIGKMLPKEIAGCNNDHGFSFDGRKLFFCRIGPTPDDSRIYALSIPTGRITLLTENSPSYWHGVSPDGATIVYCANRNDDWDVYSIDSSGRNEKRLTHQPGLDDGPEFSPDGQWIYFNSHRSGRMHIYRMKADGSGTEQLTKDAYDNWFAHPSPDGTRIVFLSYLEDQKGQHPFGRQVMLRMMDIRTQKIEALTEPFYGGQGTINAPSWSPDGKWVAFVRYKALE